MRANWFELPVTDMDRAKQFYATIFNVKMGDPFEMNDSTLCFFPYDPKVEGATGTLIKDKANKPSQFGTLIYLSVKEIDDILARIEDAGGKIINPKMSVGKEQGFVAYFEDTEGNKVGLHQHS